VYVKVLSLLLLHVLMTVLPATGQQSKKASRHQAKVGIYVESVIASLSVNVGSMPPSAV